MSRGYLTFAQNNSQTDYLNLAYVQALSIKATQKINLCSVVVDEHTMKLVTESHREVFDHIILLPGADNSSDDFWKLKNEWKAYVASPYIETVKIEADMLFTANIDHWWDIMSQKDICFTTDVVNFRGEVSGNRAYRKLFDLNNLLNVYNGFFYFKKSPMAEKFFYYAKGVYENWDIVRKEILVEAANEQVTTDVVFAIACKLIGEEHCYLPNQAVPRFAHMKGAINGFHAQEDWRTKLIYQFDQNTLTVGFSRQTVPFHYHYKDFITKEIASHYETLA
jgi:hypothetical protein